MGRETSGYFGNRSISMPPIMNNSTSLSPTSLPKFVPAPAQEEVKNSKPPPRKEDADGPNPFFRLKYIDDR